MALRFDQVPPELLVQIVSHCETATTLLSLSLTCKRIHDFIEKDGFRVFAQSRFPSFKTPPYWKDAAHGLTTLSRNWDRKAFLARRIEPYNEPHLTRKPIRGMPPSRNQTMGYQPIIDSHEEWIGGDWSSRKETVVWGAGAELIIRIRRTGEAAEVAWQADRRPERKSSLDQHHHMHDWTSYKNVNYVDGRDDITTTNIRCTAGDDVTDKHVIVGRASGWLDRIAMNAEGTENRWVGNYETKNRSVRSATVSRAAIPLLAACLADNAVALYPANTDGNIKILDEVSAVPAGKPGRTWSTRFLRQDRLAVGRGPSGQPLLVYDIGEAGFSKEPVRKYEAIFGDDETSSYSQNLNAASKSTSIYPIAPIAPSSAAGGAEGDIFLSGGYDGNVRLHDLRSPAPATAIFMDLAENSAIYSLLPLGRERFVAGASRYAMIKIFDLRMPGGKVYYAADLDPCSSDKRSLKVASTEACYSGHPCCDYHLQAKATRSNYNVYIPPPSTRNRRGGDSPVYSLSSPSPFSPTFYAGIENAVVQFDVVSAFDKHPDPVFIPASQQTPGGEGGPQGSDAVKKWDPHGEVMNLKLYEQVMGSAKMRSQVKISGLTRGAGEKGWNERWVRNQSGTPMRIS